MWFRKRSKKNVQRLATERATGCRKLCSEALEDRLVLATFSVTALGDSGAGTLRSAVNMSNQTAGIDTIIFDASLNGQTISLSTGQLDINDPVTITAEDLPDGITVDASAGDPTPEINDGLGIRVFHVRGESTITAPGIVHLVGMKLQGGDVTGYGGLIRSETSIRLVDMLLQDGYATRSGGGLFDEGSIEFELPAAEILQSRIINNESGENGGGAVLDERSIVVDSQFSGNIAGGSAGGLSASRTMITNSEFSNNTAGSNGGGLSVFGYDNSSLDQVVVTGNSAQYGGGLLLLGRVSLKDVLVSGNVATMDGGGIKADPFFGGLIPVENLTVSGNSAGRDGGGIQSSSQYFRLSDTTIIDNSAERHGGGISLEFNDRDPAYSITSSIISGNSAAAHGGGIHITQHRGNTLIQNVTVSGNSSGANGGGVHLSGLGQTVNLVQATISGNSAVGAGGGAHVSAHGGSLAISPQATFSNSTVVLNAAGIEGVTDDEIGGGIHASSNYPNVIRINNSIVANNTRGIVDAAPTSDDVSSSAISPVQLASHSLIEAIPSGEFDGESLITGVDPLLGPLTANGGSFETHLPLEGSPVLDAGNMDLMFGDPLFDQRGNEFGRLRDGNNDGLATIDIGAVEAIGNNLPPIANISQDVQTARQGEVVSIDGSLSTDPDGDDSALTFLWSVVSTPSNANASIADPTAPAAAFSGDEIGTYELLLEVNDGVESSFAFVNVDVVDNSPPDTSAFVEDGPYFAGVPFTLDARASTDPDGDPINFTFTPAANVTVDESEPGLATFVFDQPATGAIVSVRTDDGALDGLVYSFTIDIGEAETNSWHNTGNPLDVNNDGAVAPLDALLVINELTLREFSDPETSALNGERPVEGAFLDVTNDQAVSPLDALTVINELNSNDDSSDDSDAGAAPIVFIPFRGIVDRETDEKDDANGAEGAEEIFPLDHNAAGRRYSSTL